jgi:hypothetical protein
VAATRKIDRMKQKGAAISQKESGVSDVDEGGGEEREMTFLGEKRRQCCRVGKAQTNQFEELFWRGSVGARSCMVLPVSHTSISMCNRVRDRYEEGCTHSCASRCGQANAVTSYANGMKEVTCDYKRERIKSKYSKKVYTEPKTLDAKI